jgi:hypothetical protein
MGARAKLPGLQSLVLKKEPLEGKGQLARPVWPGGEMCHPGRLFYLYRDGVSSDGPEPPFRHKDGGTILLVFKVRCDIGAADTVHIVLAGLPFLEEILGQASWAFPSGTSSNMRANPGCRREGPSSWRGCRPLLPGSPTSSWRPPSTKSWPSATTAK